MRPAILDAHLHLWDRTRFAYPWMAGLPALPTTSLPEQLETTATGAIVVEAGICADQALAEVEWLSRLAAGSPFIRGIVAAVDFTDPHLAEVLDRLREHPLVVGVRDNFEGRAPGDLDAVGSPVAWMLLRGIDEALSAGLSVDLCVRAAQLGELDRLLTALVEHRGSAEGLVLDHLGKPLPADREFSRPAWAEALTALAAHPGLAVKFSGLPGQMPWPVSAETTAELARDFAGTVLEAFGEERVLYGSDHPVSTTAHGIDVRIWEQAALEAIGALTDDAGLARVMGGTAERIYLDRAGRDQP